MQRIITKLRNFISQPLILAFGLVCVASLVKSYESFSSAQSLSSSRNPKLMYFPFVKVVIPPEPCGTEVSTGVRSGACLPRGGCEKARGTKGSDCSYGFGECCTITTNCTEDRRRIDVIDVVTTLKTPNPATTSCNFKIRKLKDMCQVRLDFVEFRSTGANDNGECVEDRLVISNSITVPDGFTVCGNLDKQHMYLAFGTSESIDLTPVLRSSGSQYQIVATQIPCLSRRVVPSHCLQYFNKTTDIVRSFDYGRQQQSSQKYTICIEGTETSQAITWRPCTAGDGVIDRAFSISSGFSPLDTVTTSCNRDWVQINGDNRRCGDNFPAMVSSPWKPYTLNINFDENEIPPFPVPMTPAGEVGSADCVGIGTSSGGLLRCYWDTTVPPPGGGTGGTCQCTYLVNPVAVFGPPDTNNTGFCLKYSL